MNKKLIKKIMSSFRLIDLIGIGIFLTVLVILTLFFLRKSSFTYVTLLVSKDRYSFNSLYSYKPPNWYLENLTIGMTNKDIVGKTDLELVDMYYYPTVGNESELYITLKVKTTFNQRSQQHSYQGQPLLIGESRAFKLSSTYIPGNIHKIEDQLNKDQQTKKIIVHGELESNYHEKIPNFNIDKVIYGEVRFFGIKNYLADKVVEGLTIRDSKDEKLVEVTDVKKTTGYKEFVHRNSFIKTADYERQIVKLTAEINLRKVNDKYLHMEAEQILIGKTIQLPFENFVVYLTIEKIENSN